MRGWIITKGFPSVIISRSVIWMGEGGRRNRGERGEEGKGEGGKGKGGKGKGGKGVERLREGSVGEGWVRKG